VGILHRLRTPRVPASARVVSAHLHPGEDDLEVAGDVSYQEILWSLCGGHRAEPVRHGVVAVLVPEPENPHDANAIAVRIDGRIAGYLPRDVAARYRNGLHVAMSRCGGHVALRGTIVGGPELLTVWLEHDPAHFGVVPDLAPGAGEAWLTDVDDAYDLSWFDDLPDADAPATLMLRDLLANDPDPVDRHFQFAELESRLARTRALDEHDRVCRRHDAEMEVICAAFLRRWGKLPLLETYRRMAVRRQLQRDWRSCRWWTERGLSLSGGAASPEVAELRKLHARAMSKVDAPAVRRPRRDRPLTVTLLDQSPGATWVKLTGDVEQLVCTACRTTFERLKVRGRKPLLCPDCRATTS
jgi:hypothetical protein